MQLPCKCGETLTARIEGGIVVVPEGWTLLLAGPHLSVHCAACSEWTEHRDIPVTPPITIRIVSKLPVRLSFVSP